MSKMRQMRRVRGAGRGVAVAAVIAFAGCSRFRAAANAPDKPPAGPTDGNMTAMLLAANNTDISYARLVPARSTSPAVKDFAARMLADHGAVNTALTELVARTEIKPVENQESLAFRDESTSEREILTRLGGRQFDAAYVANEISYHTKLLATLDNALIPRARDAQLRQILVSVRPAVAAHLAHAERVQAALR
jgi:putative membrane protein